MLARLQSALAERYAIERELGRGGMATVYLAQDLKHHRRVAIKVLKPEVAAALGPERFLREIEIAAGLTHPHILALHNSGEDGGFLYYVMPYIDGESLRERLSRERQLALGDAVRITGEIASALDHAHRRNVLHRDVKPENILLQEGHAVVADFGIARAILTAGGDTLTATGLTVGTPAYMSPEQAAGERQLDGRSDLYSLGCVVYEMLAGQPPFTGPTVESVLHQHLTADPAPVTQLRRTVPESVVPVLGRALAKAPADRYTTTTQFAQALDAALRLQPPGRSRRRSVGPVVGVAAVAALGVAFLLVRSRWAAGAVVPSASTIAVMPFIPVASAVSWSSPSARTSTAWVESAPRRRSPSSRKSPKASPLRLSEGLSSPAVWALVASCAGPWCRRDETCAWTPPCSTWTAWQRSLTRL